MVTDVPTDVGPMHSASGTVGSHWTTANVGEAIPGVQSPLSWSLWRGTVDRGLRQGAYALGAMSTSERDDDREMLVDVFFGRVAVRVSFFAFLGNRMPGTRSEDIIRTYFGTVPDGLDLRETRRRWPVVAGRLPVSFIRQAGKVRRFASEQDRWWRDRIDGLGGLYLEDARRALAEAADRHADAVAMQCVATLVAIQPAYDALVRLAARGDGDVSEVSAVPGGPEMEVVADIWRASRNELSIDELVRRHGFHGPSEGEAASRVWREDRAPLEDLVGRYAARPDEESPIEDVRARLDRRPEVERQFLAALPVLLRPVGRAVISLVRSRIPLRGLAKRSLLQTLDAARGAARRVGEHLVSDGVLDDVDDVTYLTVDELLGPLPDDPRAVVAERRAIRAAYQSVSVPPAWSDTPLLVPDRSDEVGEVDVIRGTGVSSGRVEGTARVLLTPDFSTFEEGDILVAPVTDPSWCGIMFLASGLVVDVGGALSHAAVVARELGQPCVVATGDGTRRIRTGDHLVVDGDSGEVRRITASTGAHVDTHIEPSEFAS